MVQIDQLILNQEHSINGWRPARPINGPFLVRILDAWLVLTGKYVAIYWSKSKKNSDIYLWIHHANDSEEVKIFSGAGFANDYNKKIPGKITKWLKIQKSLGDS